MSEYDNIPSTPFSDPVGFTKNVYKNANEPKTGVIFKDPNKENLAMDIIMDGNPLGAVAKFGTTTLKNEACTPAQLQNLEDERRTSGIPVTQGIVLGIEKAASFITGNDVQFDTAMTAASAIDTVAKPIVTGGVSFAADTAYEASRDLNDAANCMSEEKPIVPDYNGEEKFTPGQYPHDAQVYAQSTATYDPNGLSAKDLSEVGSMYSADNTTTPSGIDNPNRTPTPGELVDATPESRTPLNVKVTPRQDLSYSGPGR